jgi:hypothetical protein
MIKKYTILAIFIFSSTQTYCNDNSIYTAFKNYLNLKNSCGVALFAFGGFSFIKAMNNFSQGRRYANELEQRLLTTQNNPDGKRNVYNSFMQNCTLKGCLWATGSLASFAGSLYCLKNNFY